MEYDKDFWNRYSDENESNVNEELSKFIKDLAISLKASKVLEVGCNTGNDLNSFPENHEVYGVDLNDLALEKAKKKFPSFVFKKGSINQLPFEDSTMDLVFTHKLLNYLNDDEVESGIKELLRVSKKYVLNLELVDKIDNSEKGNFRLLNPLQNWLKCKVKIISNVNMHEDIDPEKSKFILVRKL